MGSTQRRERERHEMRELILTAAMRLFVEESFEKTTIRRIAEAIEYTPGALYGYFKDKDEILFALHERGFHELVARMEAALVGLTEPAERLAAIGRAYIRFAFDNHQQYDLMFVHKSTGKRIVADAKWDCGHRAYDILRAEVTGLIASRGATMDPEIATFGCWSMVHGLVTLVLCDRCVFMPGDALPQIVDATFQQYLDLLTSVGPTR
jgi:AcrR family transcriptional regulator